MSDDDHTTSGDESGDLEGPRREKLQRLIDLVRAASISPKQRKSTVPSKAANRRRLEAKKTRAATKQLRGAVREFD